MLLYVVMWCYMLMLDVACSLVAAVVDAIVVVVLLLLLLLL